MQAPDREARRHRRRRHRRLDRRRGALARQLGALLDITLVESDEIGTVGVGEVDHPDRAHLPPAARHRRARVHARDPGTLQARHRVRELGARSATATSTPSATSARATWMADFHHFWLRGARAAASPASIGEYCLELQAAERRPGSPRRRRVAHQLRLSLRRQRCTPASCAGSPRARGVKRIEGKIDERRAARARRLHRGADAANRASGSRATCSSTAPAFAALLIEQTLQGRLRGLERTGCRATARVAVQTEIVGAGDALHPRDRARCGLALAHPAAASRRQRPRLLQRISVGRRGAAQAAGAAIEGEPLHRAAADPLQDRPAPQGLEQELRRDRPRQRLRRAARIDQHPPDPDRRVTRLMQLFPFAGFNDALHRPVQPTGARASSSASATSSSCTTSSTERDDTPFWRHCREMEIPESLAAPHRLVPRQRAGLSGRGRAVPRRFLGAGHARSAVSRRATI